MFVKICIIKYKSSTLTVDLYLTQDLFHLLLCHIQLTLLSNKIKSEDENLKMAVDINDTNDNHRPVSKTAQHRFDESPTIPAPLSPSLYCGAQVCGQEYCIRSLFCSTIHFSSPTQPLPNFRLFSF